MLNNLGWQPGCREPKLIGLTSCCSGEGVSTVATQLAICASRLSANVLLIDGNPNRPSLHLPFRIRSLIGFAEYLQDGNTLDSVHDSGVPHLSIMPFGKGELSPLPVAKFEKAMEPVLAEYDLVILDLPSISTGPQTVGWASAFKNLLLVISQSTATSVAAKNKRLLENAGARLAGIVQVLN
jgi:Mrp family chromosome partitioning ATPase